MVGRAGRTTRSEVGKPSSIRMRSAKFFHHDVLRLEVPVDNAQVMRLAHPLRHLLGDGNRLPRAQRSRLFDQPL